MGEEGNLQQSIDKLMRQLNDLFKEERSFTDPVVLEMSRELDKLLLQAQQRLHQQKTVQQSQTQHSDEEE
jgi:ElaB/YqjD/DUF883 family membrane-anchored ribosome-binding protein